MPIDRAALIPALKNIATRLRIDSVRADHLRPAAAIRPAACRWPTSRRRCSSPRCASIRRIRRIPKAIASCCRRGTPRRFSTRRGPKPAPSIARELLKLRDDRIRSRRPSDAAAAVRRRRHRLARPGHLRRDRQRAQRAPHQVRLSHLRAARRRRVGGRLGLGSGRRGARSTSSTTCAASPTSTRFGQSRTTMWQHDMAQFERRWKAFGWHAIVIDGHDLDADPRRARRSEAPPRDSRR